MRYHGMSFTGTEIEEESLGHVQVSGYNGEHMAYRESMRWVKAHQPKGWDPTDPSPRFANDLHASVAEALGLDDYSELRFYTAVGSPLDYFHGVDGFFEYRGKIVTIDVTVDPGKLTAKADLVVNVSDTQAALVVYTPMIAHRLA